METLCWLVRQYVYTLPLNKQFFTLTKTRFYINESFFLPYGFHLIIRQRKINPLFTSLNYNIFLIFAPICNFAVEGTRDEI